MNPPLSKTLQALLLVTFVLCVIALLKPVSRDSNIEADLLPASRQLRPDMRGGNDQFVSWQRTLHSPTKAALSQVFFVTTPPPLVKSIPPAIEMTVPAIMTRPEAPAPGFTYLGCLLSDGGFLVFLGVGEDTEVVAVGDMIDQVWRLEGVDDRGIQLRYMPLDEFRQLAVSR